MAIEEYVRVSELTEKTLKCKVKVHVSRRWTVGSKDSQDKYKRFDVVLIDEQGIFRSSPEIPLYKFDFVEFDNVRLLSKANTNLKDKCFLNSTSTTQIYVNLDIPEVSDLQNR
ncbi:hypothetical protein IFM89_033862 [Coptis chinensis]|uniref:DUF223 domain-containing protein n=1 Tax=Coptis chinensis TaxID=261450 RepID=A0A835LK72_9MAGN|nr:hypothetical protein IFM89_033862 [Coptis chinensis]